MIREASLDRNSLCQKIYDLIQPITEFNGAEIVRIRMMGHVHRPTLQIMAEKSDCTMNLELCEMLSREYSLLLDVEDIIPGEYVLEVSSPGIDRPLTRLKDFRNWANFEATIELSDKLNGRRRFKGILKKPVYDEQSKEDFTVIINDSNVDFEIPFSMIKDAKLTLSDELLEATKNGEMLHGFACDVDDVEDKAVMHLEVEDGQNGKAVLKKSVKKIEDIEENVEALETGE